MLPGAETSELDSGLEQTVELPRLLSVSGQPQQLLFPLSSAPPSDALLDDVVAAAADPSEAVETEPRQQPESVTDMTIRTVIGQSSQDGRVEDAQGGVPLPRPPRCLGVGSASADTPKACDILRLREAHTRDSRQTVGDRWEARHAVCKVGPPVGQGQGPGPTSSVPSTGNDEVVNTLANLLAAIQTVLSSRNDVDRTLKRDRGKVLMRSDSPITDFYVYAPQLGDVGYYVYQTTDQTGGRTFAADTVSVQTSPTAGVEGYLLAVSAHENASSGLPASCPKRDGLQNIMQRLRAHLASLRHDKGSHTQMVDKIEDHASQPHEELPAMDETHLEEGLLVARPAIGWDDELDPLRSRSVDSPTLSSPSSSAKSDGIALERLRRISDASERQLSDPSAGGPPLDQVATRSSSTPFAYFVPTADAHSVYGEPITNFTRADKSPAKSAMTSFPPLLSRLHTSEWLKPPAVLNSLGRDSTSIAAVDGR